MLTILEPGATAQQTWEHLWDIFLDNKHSRAVYLENQFSNTHLENFKNVSSYCQKLKCSPISFPALVLRCRTNVSSSNLLPDSSMLMTTLLPIFNRVTCCLPSTRHAPCSPWRNLEKLNNLAPLPLVHLSLPPITPQVTVLMSFRQNQPLLALTPLTVLAAGGGVVTVAVTVLVVVVAADPTFSHLLMAAGILHPLTIIMGRTKLGQLGHVPTPLPHLGPRQGPLLSPVFLAHGQFTPTPLPQ